MNNTNDVDGEVILRSDGTEGQVQLSPLILRAVVNSVLEPRNNYTARRRKARIFNENDIAQLCKMLRQWVKAYKPETTTFSLSAQFEAPAGEVSESVITYTDLESFLTEAPRHTGKLQHVTVEMHFAVLNEEAARVEMHSAFITLSGTVNIAADMAGEQDELGSPPYIRENENWSIYMSIQYSQYLIARGLVGVVDEWYNSLKKLDFGRKRSWTTRLIRFLTADDELYDWPWKIVLPMVLVGCVLVIVNNMIGLSSDISLSILGFGAILFAIVSYMNAFVFHHYRREVFRLSIPLSMINEVDREEHADMMENIGSWKDAEIFWARAFLLEGVIAIIGILVAVLI